MTGLGRAPPPPQEHSGELFALLRVTVYDIHILTCYGLRGIHILMCYGLRITPLRILHSDVMREGIGHGCRQSIALVECILA